MSPSRLLAALFGLTAVAAAAPRAHACGCFAQSSPAQPVVQAGERILFAHENNQVIAYVQIRYQGAADQFAWLVPLPSVPTVGVSSNEVFRALDAATQPLYTQSNAYCYSSASGGGGCMSSGTNFGAGSGGDDGARDLGIALGGFDMGGPGDVAVVTSSIGPYDYAVLKADDSTAMFQWLTDNHYFIPTGTPDAVAPYLHPGSYFLALRLRGGASTGEIVPVVLRYDSDLPMIPITLTQVSAVDNLGIQVYLLGEARAIPRNYYNVLLDEMPIWFGANYGAQLIEAVHAAPGKHGFVTESAGPTGGAGTVLDYPGRWGDLDRLRSLREPALFLEYLFMQGFTVDGTLLAILSQFIPEPPGLVAKGVTLEQYYRHYDTYGPGDVDGGVADDYIDANALTDQLVQRIVQPARDASALIGRHPYLTRLFSALSPADMTVDPVFSFNRDLPDVAHRYSATLSFPCRGAPWLTTESGFEAQYVSGLAPSTTLPAALKVELLRESGPPQTVQDNSDAIRRALGTVQHDSLNGNGNGNGSGGSDDGGCGCTVGAVAARGNVVCLLAAAGALLVLRRLRRRNG